MKSTRLLAALALTLLLWGCTSENVHYSRALFKHVPYDAELLVLVRPNDVTRLAEMAISELNFEEMIGMPLQVKTEDLVRYRDIAVEMMVQLGLPWEEMESVGVMLYFQQPVVMLTGDFRQDEVIAKLRELGFNQRDNGYFDYVYSGQQLNIPEDGLMMLAPEELLDDIHFVPKEKRLWNRQDFKDYRATSPLDNSLFVWTHPPDTFLEEFEARDMLGDLSLGVSFRSNLSLKFSIRVKDPQKTVYLHDVILGSVMVGRGLFGEDPDYGPVLRGIKVTQDNKQVEVSLVAPPDQLKALKARVIDDFENPNSKTAEKLRQWMEKF